MASGGNLESGEPEFQIAPMIDVLLVILIFFMTITSAQVLRIDRNIQLPVSLNAVKKDTMRNEAIINVSWNSSGKVASFMLNDRVYTKPAELIGPLKTAKSQPSAQASVENPEFRVVIRGDREAPAHAIASAMNAAAEAGISDISFSTTNRE